MKKLILPFIYILLLSHCATFNDGLTPTEETTYGISHQKRAACSATIAQGSTEYCNAISQYGITWTFSSKEIVGQFVTGDYFVVDDGSVTVSSVSPGWDGTMHGSELNPDTDISSAGWVLPSQGLHSEADGYGASLRAPFPVDMKAGDALLSTIGNYSRRQKDWDWRDTSFGWIDSAAVLTVVSSQPAANTFRPSYLDRTQTMYTTSDVNYDLLPSLSTNDITLPKHPGYKLSKYFLRGLQRPWVIHGWDWFAAQIHPCQNMFQYHELIADFLSEVLVYLVTDKADTDVINAFIQVGIDYYYSVGTVPNTSDSSTWAAPIVVTGLLLDAPDIYNFWIKHPAVRTQRGHEKFYHIGDVVESTSSSIVPKGETWVGWSTPEGKYPAFRKQIGSEYEHLHPSEWTCYEPACQSEVYRAQHDVYPVVGMILATIILDAESDLDVNAMLAKDAIRDYIDRWMGEGFMTDDYKSTGRTYRKEMEKYTQFRIYEYRYGSSGSAFIDDMWETYRDYKRGSLSGMKGQE